MNKNIEKLLSYSIQEISEIIDISLDHWSGNCYAIALALVKNDLVRGKARYGLYHGYIDEDSIFSNRKFTHHGWVEDKGFIIDPTRWVFENKDPYIFYSEKPNRDYDFGGNDFRKSFLSPAPKFNFSTRSFKVPEHLINFCQMNLELVENHVSTNQLCWLCSLPLDMLGDFSYSLFSWVIHDLGMPGFIPLDNREEIVGLI